MAIDYIKALKLTLEQTSNKLAAAEAKLATPSSSETSMGDSEKSAISPDATMQMQTQKDTAATKKTTVETTNSGEVNGPS